MPAIAPGSKILITSGSGFIGAQTILSALKQGYKVRTTVRSNEKGDYLVKLFESVGYKSDKFEYVIVEDLEKADGFDEAVQGVQGVAHTGSPFYFTKQGEDDPYEKLINPAVNGTTSILKSVQKHGSEVQRVVITSSFASVLHPVDGVVTYDVDKDWNTHAPAELEKKGKDVDGPTAYRASKTLAEKAAWKFVEDHKPKFDLVTVCPPLVLGPHIHQVESPEKLNTSSKQAYDLFTGAKKEGLTAAAGNCVDVRDVADIHIAALAEEKAGGQRVPASYGPYTWGQFAAAIHSSKHVSDAVKGKATKVDGKDGEGVKQSIFDGSKSEKLFGTKFKDIAQQTDGMALAFQDYEKRNWKGLPSPELLKL